MGIQNTKQKYTNQIFKDLNLENLGVAEKEKVLNRLEERFNSVIITTMLRLMNKEQKQRFKVVISKPEELEEESEKIASEIPFLDEALETALLAEYEIIKQAMGQD